MDEHEQEAQKPDLAGYPNEAELVKGYRASSEEAKRLRDENQRIKDALIQAAAANQRPAIPQRDGTPYDRLSNVGVPADDLREAIVSEVRQLFAPIERGLQARGQVLTKYPDYSKYEAEVQGLIDPELFKAAPDAAMELAYLRYGNEKRREVASETEPKRRSRADSAEASIPNQRGGETRRGSESQDLVREALERYRKEPNAGTARAYAKARLGGVIKDDFLNA